MHTKSLPLCNDYDPFAGLLWRADPYRIYDAVSSRAAVSFNETRGFWAVGRFPEAQACLRARDDFSTASGVDIDDTGDQYGDGDFLDEDPPEHDLLRNVVREFFLPKRIRGLGGFVEAESERLLSRFFDKGGGDFAQEVAWQLPISVAAHLIGIPTTDRDKLHEIQRRFGGGRQAGKRELPRSAVVAAEELRIYFVELVEARRRSPREDMVTAIATAKVAGRDIGDHAIGMVFLLFVASIETTAGLLSQTITLLGRHPEQRQLVHGDRTRVPATVEELLRYEPPIQVTRRVAKRDVELGEVTLPAGSDVFVMLAAANRDESRFRDAATFDVRRESLRHLTFGEGIHHCIGAPLARLEGGIVLNQLLDSVADYTVGEGHFARSHLLRAHESLMVNDIRMR